MSAVQEGLGGRENGGGGVRKVNPGEDVSHADNNAKGQVQRGNN